LNLDQTATLSSNVVTQEINGETVLLDLASEYYFGLDEIGTRVWQLLAEKKNLRSVVSTLLSEFDVAEATLLADIDKLMQDITKQGLVSLQSSATT
jgi:hypothetical protein